MLASEQIAMWYFLSGTRDARTLVSRKLGSEIIMLVMSQDISIHWRRKHDLQKSWGWANNKGRLSRQARTGPVGEEDGAPGRSICHTYLTSQPW